MIIQLGLFEYKHLFLLLFPIFRKIRNFIGPIIENKNPYYKSFNEFLSLTCCGFIHLIIKYTIKPENKNKTIELKKTGQLDSINSIKDISELNGRKSSFVDTYIKIKKEDEEKIKLQNKNNILFILLISILQIIASLSKNIFREYIKPHLLYNLPILLESFFLIIFSMIFLGFSLYNHQYLSIIIILLCIIIFFIESIIYEIDLTVMNIFQNFIYFFFFEKLYCLSDVLGKKYLNTYMDDVYLFLFKIGIITTIPLLIYDIIAYVCQLNIKYHGIIQAIFVDLKFWAFPLNLLFYIIYEIGLWLTIYYFSPCHFIILETLGDFLELIFSFFDKNDKVYNIHIKEQIITFCVLYPIIIFELLVFNEIIILNFCGLNENTKMYIMKRELVDDKQSYYSESNSIEEDDNSNNDNNQLFN